MTILRKYRDYQHYLFELNRTSNISLEATIACDDPTPACDPEAYYPSKFEDNLAPINFFLCLGGDYKFAREVTLMKDLCSIIFIYFSCMDSVVSLQIIFVTFAVQPRIPCKLFALFCNLFSLQHSKAHLTQEKENVGTARGEKVESRLLIPIHHTDVSDTRHFALQNSCAESSALFHF